MSDVQFEDQGAQFTSRKIFKEKVRPGMVRFLVKMGLAKNDVQAGYLLSGFVVVAIGVTLFLFFSVATPSPPEDTKVLPSELLYGQ